MELGVNPNQATTAGINTVTDAGQVMPLDSEFSNLISDALAAAGEPEVTGGYQSFHDEWSGAVRDVARHGGQVGHNTSGVAAHSVGTDDEIEAGYRGAAGNLPSTGGILRGINR